MKELPCRVIIVAGGQGKRMGGEKPKQYQLLAGRPVICHTLEVFQSHPRIDSIALVVNCDNVEFCRSNILGSGEFTKVDTLTIGGKERSDSVRSGLAATSRDSDGIVLVHDAVRPFVSAALINRIIKALEGSDAVVPCLPVVDTVKKNIDGRLLQATVDRDELRRIQTPQGFLRTVLEAAYSGDESATDDASLVARLGIDIIGIEGEERNIKITKPEDLLLAQFFLSGNDN